MNVKNLLFSSGYTVAEPGKIIHDDQGKIHEFLAQYNFREDASKSFIDESNAKHTIYKNPTYLGSIEVIQHEGQTGVSYILKN